jgi:hypothetical protein
MTEFFTWDSLSTVGGAIMAVELLTELFKEVGFFKRIPTRLLSFGIAATVLGAAFIFSEPFSFSGLFLSIFNSAFISLSANGVYDTLTHK